MNNVHWSSINVFIRNANFYRDRCYYLPDYRYRFNSCNVNMLPDDYMNNAEIEQLAEVVAGSVSMDRRLLVKLVAFLTREIACIEGDSFDQVLAEIGVDCDAIYRGELEEVNPCVDEA